MATDPDDNAAAKIIAQRLSPERQKWFDDLALRGAHEYAVELEREIDVLRQQLAQTDLDTAIRMRSACVEKVRALRDTYNTEASFTKDRERSVLLDCGIVALNQAIKELESLSLQEQKS